jgi:hypothetical protein
MKFTTLILAGLLVVLSNATAWAQNGKPDETAVYRYVSMNEEGRWSGKPVLRLVFTPALGDKIIDMIVPNNNMMGHKYDPPQFVVDLVKGLKPGDLMKIKTFNSARENTIIINQIERYKSAPGEDEPGVFLFQSANPDSVVLAKFLVTQNVPLATKKDADGKMVPDADLKKIIDGLKAGQAVDILVVTVDGKPTLNAIAPYAPPLRGKFIKLTETQVGVVKLPAVEIEGEKSAMLTLVIQSQAAAGGKLAPLPELLKQIKALKAGQPILFKTRKDDQATWLTQVRPDQAVAPAKPNS